MSATEEPTGTPAVDRPVCGKWMPRADTHCARQPGHPPSCATPEAMARQRARTAQRKADRSVTSEDRQRWNKAYKFSRLGITEERFHQMLEAQGYACAMCFGVFAEDDRICVDHDHQCCPRPARPKDPTRTCGKCVRGLLCFRCNTTLGYIELYGTLARRYLLRVAQAKEDKWMALLGLVVGDAGIEPATSSV
jgi:hypothetical protein